MVVNTENAFGSDLVTGVLAEQGLAMSIFGTFLPYIGRVIGPCDADGVPAMTEAEVKAAHWEVPCWCVAWFGFAGLFPFGDVQPRLVDAHNPRQYASGGL